MSGDLSRGQQKVSWAEEHMPVLSSVRSRFASSRPLRDTTLSMVLHVEAKTGVLALTLKDAGAEVHLAAGNPLSTDDDVVAALEAAGISTKARKGESVADFRQGIRQMLDADPDVIVDDGADLVALAHETRKDRGKIRGSTEETTTGVTRLKAMEREGVLRFPAVDVNDAPMKQLFDNRFGCGQSFLDGLFQATNLIVAGKVAVVAGFGWVGKGVAERLRGMGADLIVTEVDPVRAVEARMTGYRVRPMLDAAREADLIVTTTGQRDVVRKEHFQVMKDGCLLANIGHFDIEIAKKDLEGLAVSHRTVRSNVEEFRFSDGRRAYLLAEGRLINLATGQGHPVEIMDLSFALQALCVEWVNQRGTQLPPKVYAVPHEIDDLVARGAAAAFGAGLDELTEEQKGYARAWREGT